jgi:hypothetical protein
MNRRLAAAYALWIGSFAVFAWLATWPGGTVLLALVASLAVLSWLHPWATAKDPEWRR